MAYEDFASAQSFFLWSTFAIALVMGAVVNKTNFCTMGAVSDWVNMGDTGRLRAWMLAIAVGVLGVAGLEAAGLVNVTSTFPPYRQTNFVWLENLLGGARCGGCGRRGGGARCCARADAGRRGSSAAGICGGDLSCPAAGDAAGARGRR